MKKYAYPVILFYSEEEKNYTVLIPDLDIVASGETVEKAYLSAEDYLETFLDFAEKMESPITTFDDTQRVNPKRIILLVDAETEGGKIFLPTNKIIRILLLSLFAKRRTKTWQIKTFQTALKQSDLQHFQGSIQCNAESQVQ